MIALVVMVVIIVIVVAVVIVVVVIVTCRKKEDGKRIAPEDGVSGGEEDHVREDGGDEDATCRSKTNPNTTVPVEEEIWYESPL